MSDAGDLFFDWDRENIRHLRRHRVAPEEFEQVLMNEPMDIENQNEAGEERFKSIGVTDTGRALVAVWTFRKGRVSAVTAYRASKFDEKQYVKYRG